MDEICRHGYLDNTDCKDFSLSLVAYADGRITLTRETKEGDLIQGWIKERERDFVVDVNSDNSRIFDLTNPNEFWGAIRKISWLTEADSGERVRSLYRAMTILFATLADRAEAA